MYWTMFGDLKANIGDLSQLLSGAANQVQITILNPGAKKTVGPGKLKHIALLEPAFQRFDPQAKITARQSWGDGTSVSENREQPVAG